MQALLWAVFLLIVTVFLLWCSSALCLRVLGFSLIAVSAISTQDILADFLSLLHHCSAGCLPARAVFPGKDVLSGNCTYSNK